MTPILATNYGDAGVVLMALATLALSVIVGAIALVTRSKRAATISGIVAFIVGLFFLQLLKGAHQNDFTPYISIALFSFFTAAALVFFRRSPKA
jgi:hypothetical protein